MMQTGPTRASDSSRPPPLLSIIIATYNAAATLERCLDSLRSCDLDVVEVIIKDGGSTDATPWLAAAGAAHCPVRFISQPDSGIHEAWNQAIAQATGRWLLFLGADDFICTPQRLTQAVQALDALPDGIAYAAAPVVLVNQQGFAVDTLVPSRNLNRDLPVGMPLPHQGLFHRRSLFAVNHFDTSLRITGDYDFICRTLRPDNLTYLEIPPPVCMSLGGVSSSLRGLAKRNGEALRVSQRYFQANRRLALWKRLMLSYGYLGLARLCGERVAVAWADRYRRLLGKSAIWGDTSALPKSLRLPPQHTTAPEGPLFSLLVATLNRREPLARLLESLARQSLPPQTFEVLVADQNAPSFLQPILDAFAPRLNLRVVRVPPRGVSQARNALLPLARGVYVAFPDDDCWYAENTLQEAMRCFENFLHVQVLLGGWSASEASASPPSQPNTLCSWRRVFRRGETYVQFFRQEVVAHLGALDPVIGPGTGLPFGCGEDTDYLLRALEASFSVMYAPAVHVRHPETDTHSAVKHKVKIRSYAMGRMYLLHKHRLPLWFQLLNIVYPLARLLLREGPQAARYRMIMFSARLQSFFSVRGKASPRTRS